MAISLRTDRWSEADMTIEAANGPVPENRIGRLFDLSAEDAALLEQICQDLLKQAGIDGARFLEGLRQGQPFGEALGMTPEISELIYARAHRWFSIGRPDRAEPLFRALCIAEAHAADYWVGLGVCLRLRKDWDGAELAFAIASRLRPDWAVPVFHACELALASGNLATAQGRLDRFRELVGLQRLERAIPESMIVESDRLAKALQLRRSPAPRP
jgi:tetratricopeptide (TPR) repeat protein